MGVDALTRLYGIANPNNQPMAELWMGAHPKSPS
ncbi:type I phosphomannose isomerase catalytic subunit, partial [Serratia bockelmannii]